MYEVGSEAESVLMGDVFSLVRPVMTADLSGCLLRETPAAGLGQQCRSLSRRLLHLT